MSLTAAASGFVVFLVSVSVVQGPSEWRVIYTSAELCALKGSTVDIKCNFTHPSTTNGRETKIVETFWFTKREGSEFVDILKLSEVSGRVQSSCDHNSCTLTITDVRESDSAEYKFRFTTSQPGGSYTVSPGVTLSVTALRVEVIKAYIYESYTYVELMCQSRCRLPGHPRYVWYKNRQNIQGQTSVSYSAYSYSKNSYYSCAADGHEGTRSPLVYGPKLPSVSVSPSGEIVEGSSVTLSCSSDANPAANYTWYKKDGKTNTHRLTDEAQLVFRSIQSSDTGKYYCSAKNKLGSRSSKHISFNVKHAPKLPSVSVSPSGEIVEGSSVTLSCSSDANPAANYTWFKEDQTLFQGPAGFYNVTFISSKDRGLYHCRSENQYGQMVSTLLVDVQYGPKLPSVSVSPSGEIVEGSSVNLSCSSDANPAANYTWYKEDEESPKASGQTFIITDFRPEHSGNYYCEALNSRGRHNSTLHLVVVVAGSPTLMVLVVNIIRLTLVVLMVIPLVLLSLWRRRKETVSCTAGPHEPVEMREFGFRSEYENVSDLTAAQTEEPESSLGRASCVQ